VLGSPTLAAANLPSVDEYNSENVISVFFVVIYAELVDAKV
jgi:hypothetical protein